MRFGLVGVGRIGAAHAEALAAHPDVTELVIADADAARAQVVADKLDARAGSIEQASESGVDAVVVAAATPAHAELVLRGVRAGRPVFCEKPVSSSVEGTLEVLAQVQASGVPVQVGFQRRFDAGYAAAREALRAGELGELHRAHVLTGDQAPPDPSYIPGSGGIYADCHIHDFDILRWVTGREVRQVYALGANRGAAFFREGGDVDNSAAVLTLDDDTLVTLQGSRYNGAGHDVRMELAGTRATYSVGFSDRMPLRSAEAGVHFPAGVPWPNYWERFLPAYVAEMRAFVDLVRDGGESPCTVQDGLEAQYVAAAAALSLREGRPVQVEQVRR